MKKFLISISILIFSFVFVGCVFSTDADVASYNLSQDAENFKVFRRAVFYNGITGEYILVIEGYLSIEDQGNQLEVTIKKGNGEYLKHFLGLSDNVTYIVEQLEGKYVSDSNYKVVFKPSTIIPVVEIR